MRFVFFILILTCSFSTHAELDQNNAQSNAQSNAHSNAQWLLDESAQILRNNILEPEIASLEKRKIIVAGSEKFRVLWTRDFAFAALGALAIGETEAVRGGLDAIIHYQRNDGLFPRRLGDVSNVMRGLLDKLGVPRKEPKILKKAEFKSGLGGVPIDSNPLIAWILDEYVTKTNDVAFAEDVWFRMILAFDWMEAREQEGLIVQDAFADWKDVTPRKGKVMYTNALYYRGLVAMGNLAERLGRADDSRFYFYKAAQLRTLIRETFWDSRMGFFKDELHNRDTTFFSADGNLFGILFRIADANQAESILTQTDLQLVNPVNGLIANTNKPYKKVPLSIKIVGIRGYSDSTYIWPWNSALYVLAALEYPSVTNHERAHRVMNHIYETVQRYGFQEAHEKNGKPVQRWAHKSEPNFSWFAGFVAKAADQILH